MTIIIDNLRHEVTADGFDATADIVFDGQCRQLTFTVSGNHPDLGAQAPKFDPFAVALLIPAMQRGTDMVVEGSINETLLFNLRTGIQPLLRSIYPRWHRVEIAAEPRAERTELDRSLGAAMGISCGIDSLFTYSSLAGEDALPGHHRIRMLLHNNVGGVDPTTDVDRVFARQHAHVARFADQAGLPLVSVSCDLGPYYEDRFKYHHTLRNLCAAMSVDHLFHTFHYSAGKRIGKWVGGTITDVELSLLPQFDTGANRWLQYGGHASRLQKMIAILDRPELARHLHVCVRGIADPGAKLNCGRCFKCAPVVAYALATGTAEAIRELFDIDAFHRHHTHAMARLLRNSVWRNVEDDIHLLAFLADRGYPLPAWVRPFLPLVRRAGRRFP